MRRQATIPHTLAGIGAAAAASLIAASAAAGPPAFGFRQTDINDNGRIAPFEARRTGLAKDCFERWDHDDDGVVSRLEWRTGAGACAGESSGDPSRI